MNAKLIIIVFIVIVIVLFACLVGPTIIDLQNVKKQDSQLVMTSNNTLYEEGNFTVKLMDASGSPIADGKLSISIFNESNSSDYSLETDSNGEAILKLDKPIGKYTINCTFIGNDVFKPTNLIQRIEIMDDFKEAVHVLFNQTNATSNNTIYYDDNLNIYRGDSGLVSNSGGCHTVNVSYSY